MYQDNEPEELEELEEDMFDDMDRGELKEFIRKNELTIHVTKAMSDDDIRKIIRVKQAAIAEIQRKANKKQEILRKLFWREKLSDRIILWVQWGGLALSIIGIIFCIIMANITN